LWFIWYILWLFGIFFPFWYVDQEPWLHDVNETHTHKATCRKKSKD
jgi:hypothetical protein